VPSAAVFYLGEWLSNSPDDCPCSCSQVDVTKGDAATTDAGWLQYSSQTQSHPVLMFALSAPFDQIVKIEAEVTVGDINSPYFQTDVYFGAPSQGVIDNGLAIFGVQFDAGSMSAGVYDWQVDLRIYEEGLYYESTHSSGSYDPDVRPVHIANRDDSQYGDGWSMIYDARLMIQDGLPGQADGVALVTGNNDVTWFYSSGGGGYTREGNSTNFSDLQKDDNGTGTATDDAYILSDPYGTVSTFDYQGLLQTVVDRNGNALATYTYGTGADADKVVDIEDQAGRHTHFEYDSGLLVAVTDFYGTAGFQTTEYDYYSGTNRLHHMIEPDPDGSGPLTSPVTTYDYNSLGLLDSVIDPRGLETTVAYDQARRVSSITERCGGVTNITSLQSLVMVDLATNGPNEEDWAQLDAWLWNENLTDAEIEAAFAGDMYETRLVFGNEMKIIRDRFGNINYMQDANGTITKYKRNSTNGLLTQVEQPDPDNPSGTLTTSFGYDNQLTTGRLVSISHPDGIGYQSWSYGAFGQVASYSDNVHSTTYLLDNNGNVETMTQSTGTEFLVTTYTYTDGTGTTAIKGLVETVTDPNLNVTSYTYNSEGLAESATYAETSDDEVTVVYEYDDRDRVSAMIDGRGARTEYLYDNLDRLIQRTDPDPDTGGITSASPVWQYRYDPSGNQTHVIDPLGNATEYVYDTRDRPEATIQHSVSVPSPIAYWKLNETSGTTAYDSSYTGNTGTVTGTANWVAGMHDNGFQFNGATKIQATGLLGNPQNISVAAWANLTQTDHKGSEIISLGDHFSLRLDDSVTNPGADSSGLCCGTDPNRFLSPSKKHSPAQAGISLQPASTTRTISSSSTSMVSSRPRRQSPPQSPGPAWAPTRSSGDMATATHISTSRA
jgi:YD repeat-containing protein